MINIKDSKVKITGKSDEIMSEIFSILADPQILKVSLEYKDAVEGLDKVASSAAELGKVLGETEKGTKLINHFKLKKEIANFLTTTIMEALRLGEGIRKC